MTENAQSFACHECGYRFPPAITMGVVEAHFITEHPDADLAVDLVEDR